MSCAFLAPHRRVICHFIFYIFIFFIIWCINRLIAYAEHAQLFYFLLLRNNRPCLILLTWRYLSLMHKSITNLKRETAYSTPVSTNDIKTQNTKLSIVRVPLVLLGQVCLLGAWLHKTTGVCSNAPGRLQWMLWVLWFKWWGLHGFDLFVRCIPWRLDQTKIWGDLESGSSLCLLMAGCEALSVLIPLYPTQK